MSSSQETASAAIDAVLDDAVATLMLDQAEDKLRHQLTMSMALDTRATQVTALQLAAAAATGGWGAAQHTSAAAAAAVILATVAFLVGAVVCFRGVRSDGYSPPGHEPMWWESVRTHRDLSVRGAQSWLFGSIQHSLDRNRLVDEKRADSLNLSLRYGIGGAVLIAMAALAQLTGV